MDEYVEWLEYRKFERVDNMTWKKDHIHVCIVDTSGVVIKQGTTIRFNSLKGLAAAVSKEVKRNDCGC